MGKYLVHIAIILLAVSAGCEPLDIGIEARRHGEPSGERASGREKPQVTKADTFVYVSGVEFPESYDWATDSAFGNVSSKLVLFRDGVRVCEIPAGPGTVFSADPDMHRIAGGHLWTDGLSGTTTDRGEWSWTERMCLPSGRRATVPECSTAATATSCFRMRREGA